MLDETTLVKGVRAGDPAAMRQLVSRYQRLVLGMVARVVRDTDAQQDLCQEVFIKVYQHMHKFRFGSALSTWIGRIAYLTAINEAKKQQRRPEVPFGDELSQLPLLDPDAETKLLTKERDAYLELLIRELPLSYQTVLELYYKEERPLAEISGITGMPEGTIKTCLFRSRQLLKEKLEKFNKRENQ